jgi:hypothetical protein
MHMCSTKWRLVISQLFEATARPIRAAASTADRLASFIKASSRGSRFRTARRKSPHYTRSLWFAEA